MFNLVYKFYIKAAIFVFFLIQFLHHQVLKNNFWFFAGYAIVFNLGVVFCTTTYAEPHLALMSFPNITDINTVRLYDKLFLEGFGKWVNNPQDLVQMYTSFIYEYACDFFRWGFYDDVFGWCDENGLCLRNYDQSFLNCNRFSCKELTVYNIEVLDPQPKNYLYRTFYLVGQETQTGIPFKLAVHDSQVVGVMLLDKGGHWFVHSGENPFIDGLSFRSIDIRGGYRTLDLLYFKDGAVDSYNLPLALESRTRVYMLRGVTLEYVPPQPIVSYAPLTELEVRLSSGLKNR